VRASRLMMLIAAASILFSILFFSVSFPFSRAVAEAFPSEANLAGFLGLFSGAATLITFLVSLALAHRVYARLGVVNAVLLLPLLHLAGFIVWFLRFDLTTAAAVRLAQLVVLSGLSSTAFSALFDVLPAERRSQVRAFQSGVPTQLGVVASGALLLLGQRVLRPEHIFILGALAAASCGYLVWRMRPAYAAALIEALRAGVVDVFSPTTPRLQTLHLDAESRRALEAGLGDPNPAIRRLALDLLAREPSPDLSP
ncbi:MAG: hypothetical protein AB1449_13430, partial [Chloroflexota bacterium]